MWSPSVECRNPTSNPIIIAENPPENFINSFSINVNIYSQKNYENVRIPSECKIFHLAPETGFEPVTR